MPISVSHVTDFENLTCAINDTLLCELSPDGQPVEALAQFRIRGFHGPMVLYGLTPMVLQSPGLEWLDSALRQELGFYTPEEAHSARTLSEAGWRHSATVLYCFATRTLNHDFKHLLREWPERRYDLQNLWDRLQGKLGQLLPLLEPQVTALTHLMHDSGSSLAALESAWLDFWSALHAGQNQTIDTEALARAVHGLCLHWPALIAERTAFEKQPWQPLEQEASDLIDLERWLAFFNARRLQQPQRVIEAAQQLKTLRVTLSAALQQRLHNTLEQHLYVVAQTLHNWQRVTDFYYPDVQGLNFNQLTLWKSRLPLTASPLTASPPVIPSQPKAADEKPYLLILEDNPVWTEHIRQQVSQDQLLSQYLSRYQWVAVNNLREAKNHLNRAAILITDLSMPLDTHEPSAREHGIAFLEAHVGQYAKNAPVVIVHTTPTHFLQDHLALSQAGVLDADYVLKNEPDVLLKRLLRACERLAQPEAFMLSLHSDYPVLNGVSLQLSPLNQELLRSLATGPCTARQLLQRLVEAGYYEYLNDLEAQADAGILITWPVLLQQLPGPLNASLSSLDDDIQRPLWEHLQQWAALSRSENHDIHHPEDVHALIPLGKQRLPHSLWFNAQLLQMLPQALHQLLQSTRDSEHPDYVLGIKVSKMVSGLRQDVYSQCVAVQQPMNIRQWITRDEHQRYGLSNTTFNPQNSAKSAPATAEPVAEAPRRWPVLLIEDDAAYAQEIQDLLVTVAQQHHLALECIPITHGDQWPEVLQQLDMANVNSLPYLVLLDLHLPAHAGSPPDARTGYRLWKALQDSLPPEQYQVLVTSTLTHEDSLRLEGVRLGIPLQQFIPKGETLHQVLWPESLHLAVVRLLQEQRQGGKVARERVRLAPVAFPLQIELVDYTQKVLHLHISLLSDPEKVYKVKHRNLHAHWLWQLLQAPNTFISAETLMQPEPCERTRVNNLRNRLRKQIEKQWPLTPLTPPGERVVNALLEQQTIQRLPHFALRVAKVIDPKGLCQKQSFLEA